MNIIKKLRTQAGYTQRDLVAKSGLSLRTIQRLEASDSPPKGYTLQVLAETFDVEIVSIQEGFQSKTQVSTADRDAIKWINLAVLFFIGIPFGNIIAPVVIWREKRESPLVDRVGREIINVQIIWTIIWCLLLCLAPFVNWNGSLILIVLFGGMGVNIGIVIYNAYLIQQKELKVLNLPLNIL